MKEKELSKQFQDYFKKWFEIKKEVYPIGSRRRIDLVLTSKLNKDYVFGVELKSPGHKQGSEFAKWLRQAEDYSKMIFNIRGYERHIPVLIYPAISAMFVQINSPHYQFHLHHNLNGIVSEFNIGEVRKVDLDWELATGNKRGYGFIYRNQLLWHEYSDHHKVNYKKYFHYSK